MYGESVKKAGRALLAMQRHSWEQGIAMQAFLEMGDMDTVTAMAWESVYRSLEDGRTAVMDNDHGATDPCAVGEGLLTACKLTGDPFLKAGYERLLEWALEKAPRNADGVVYHLADSTAFWVDSLYMLPPFLAAAGYMDKALTNFWGYVERLYDREAHLMGHMRDDASGRWLRRAHWGTGNGWALAGCARIIAFSQKNGYEKETGHLIAFGKELLDHLLLWMRSDGLFFDIVDDPASFIETNLSQMCAYTIYRGVCDGWLEQKYIEPAEKMRRAANKKQNRFGFIEGVCGAPGFDKPGFSPEGQAFYLLMEQQARKAGMGGGDFVIKE